MADKPVNPVATDAPKQILLNDAFNGANNFNPIRVDNMALAAGDDLVTGALGVGALLGNAATLGLANLEAPRSVVPDSFESYHAGEAGYRAVSGLAGSFFVAGTGIKMIQTGSKLETMLGKAAQYPGIRSMWVDKARVSEVEQAIGKAMTGYNEAFGKVTGQVQPNFNWATSLPDSPVFQGVGATYKDAAQWAKSQRTANGIKEGLAAEAALYGVYNQNSFLYPEDATMLQSLMFVGAGVGVSAGLARVEANVVMRKTAQAAHLAGVEEAKNARGLFARDTTTKVGEEWQGVLARIGETEKLDALARSANDIGTASDGTLNPMAVMDTVSKIRANNSNMNRQAFAGMAGNASNVPVMRGKVPGINFAISKSRPALHPAEADNLEALISGNRQSAVGLAFLEDQDAGINYGTARLKLQTQEAAVLKQLKPGLDPDAERKLLGQLGEIQQAQKQLDLYRGGVIEQTGVVNYSGSRYVGMLGRENVGKLQLRNDFGSSVVYMGGVPGTLEGRAVRTVQLNRHGQLTVGRTAMKAGQKLTAAELTPDEITQLYSVLGKATDASASTKTFWENFWKSAEANNMNWRELPFPLLDALISKRLPIPDSTAYAVQEMKRAIATEDMHAHTLAQKLEYFAGHDMPNADMQKFTLFDFEKMLNMRLTDVNGLPNTAGALAEMWRDNFARNGASAVDRLALTGSGMDMFADLLNTLKGKVGFTGGLQMHVDDLFEAMKGVDNFTMHEKTSGFGGVWHSIKQPTDSEFALANVVRNRNAAAMADLRSTDNPVINSVVSAIDVNPVALQQAMDISSLAQVGAKSNNLSTTTFSYRGERAIQGAAQVRKQIQSHMEQLMKEQLTPVLEEFKALFKDGDTASRLDILNWKQTANLGIQLKEEYAGHGLNEIMTDSPGFEAFMRRVGPLKNAPADGQPWHSFSVTRAVVDGEYVPVEYSPRAVHTLNKLFDLQYQQLGAMNTLRNIGGREPIRKFNGHMPVEEQGRFKLAYASNMNGDMFYIRAATQEQANKELAELIALENKKGAAPYFQLAEDEIAAHYDALDQMFLHRLRDMSGLKQTGTASGRSGHFKMDLSTDEFDRMNLSMRQSYEDLTERVTMAAMPQAMAEAQRLKGLVRDTGMVTEGARRVQAKFTGIDQWQNVLLGRDQIPEASMARKVHSTVESLFNSAVGLMDEVSPVMATVGNKLSMVRDDMLPSKAARWLGAGHDRKAAVEWLENNYQPLQGVLSRADLTPYLKLTGQPDAFKLARTLQNFNKVATQAMLTFANVAHPLLNVMGIVTTAPAVLRGVQRMDGEDIGAWKKRVGPIADYLDSDGIATVSPVKLMMEGLHIVHNDPAAYEAAKRMGYLEANMLEELHELGKLRPSKFDDAVDFGMKYFDFINLPVNAAIKRTTGRAPTYATLSERSEVYSRAWAHMMGLALARRSGKGMNEATQHAFAHWFANQNIADFAPNLRGQAFRGVAGIPFGLFQSYGINVLQRMFGYVEDRNKRAIITQLAAQGLMFGGSGMPGWPALNATMFNMPDNRADERGATSLNERVYSAFGPGFGDLLLTGAPSSLTHIFGGSGINMYTSGDMNPRNPLSMPPAFAMMQQIGEGMAAGINVAQEEAARAANGQGIDASRFAEVVANYAPSRGYRSLADLILGYRIDRRGNMVNDDTRSGVSLVARLMGARTTDETKLSAAIYENSQAQSQRIADLTNVRKMFLNQMRGKELDDKTAQLLYDRYLAAGGTERGWNAWLKNAMEQANETRGTRRLDELVKNGGEIFGTDIPKAMRLLNAGAQISESKAAKIGLPAQE